MGLVHFKDHPLVRDLMFKNFIGLEKMPPNGFLVLSLQENQLCHRHHIYSIRCVFQLCILFSDFNLLFIFSWYIPW